MAEFCLSIWKTENSHYLFRGTCFNPKPWSIALKFSYSIFGCSPNAKFRISVLAIYFMNFEIKLVEICTDRNTFWHRWPKLTSKRLKMHIFYTYVNFKNIYNFFIRSYIYIHKCCFLKVFTLSIYLQYIHVIFTPFSP